MLYIMRREAPNSHPTRIPRHASAGGREGFSKSVPLFCLRAVTFVVGGCRRRYVNKIRRLKGARVYGYTYSSPGYWSIPKENPLFDFLPSTSGYPRHRLTEYERRYVKNRSRGLRAFIIYRPVRLFACATTSGARIQHRFRPK